MKGIRNRGAIVASISNPVPILVRLARVRGGGAVVLEIRHRIPIAVRYVFDRQAADGPVTTVISACINSRGRERQVHSVTHCQAGNISLRDPDAVAPINDGGVHLSAVDEKVAAHAIPTGRVRLTNVPLHRQLPALAAHPPADCPVLIAGGAIRTVGVCIVPPELGPGTAGRGRQVPLRSRPVISGRADGPTGGTCRVREGNEISYLVGSVGILCPIVVAVEPALLALGAGDGPVIEGVRDRRSLAFRHKEK